ncbi:MAG: tRNA pseudouridine(54/55) synthase Pus10 [Candidatus Heimdallarchaeota archaeon]|nr:tRNA pseudouridine(54/55) synthase Pus10 [Candidatus Heimdallarchaeota archaeon]MBY8993191.1 tRNA pseudouridine(54/55) synthase Pus10 [Candidatus Heimdallarchaeota archaeon]
MIKEMGKLKIGKNYSKDMLELALKILTDNRLCDNCLGRQFALVGFGLTNKERGSILKNALILELYDKIPDDKDAVNISQKIANMGNILAQQSLQKKECEISSNSTTEKICELCDNLFDNLIVYAKPIFSKLENEDYQSFIIGAIIPPEILEREDNIRAKYNITKGESIKSEFTRELGKLIMNQTNKEPDFELPDITIIVDLFKQKITLQKRSLFIYGRYNKFIRTIPQTRWPCYDCNGKGCVRCGYTGKRYTESVEELIAEPILEITGGTGSRFHGAGREDIDALMLGNGRPFVLEIKEPEKRHIDLRKIEKKVNRKIKKKVKVSNLSFADKRKVQDIKSLAKKTKKTYKAKITLDKDLPEESYLKLQNELKETKIKQRTPKRVLHRRSDLVRVKMVYNVSIKKLAEKEIEAEIVGEGGLYIKELISGDEGRTNPSFSSILKSQARCIQLDVVHLHTEDT